MNTNLKFNQTEIPNNKNNNILMVLGILFIIIIVFLTIKKYHNNSNDVTPTTSRQDSISLKVNKETINSEAINQNGWNEEARELFEFSNNTKFLVLMTSHNINEYEVEAKLTAYKLNNSNKWESIWESEHVQCEKFESLNVLQSNTNAVIVGVYNLGGAHQLNNYFTIFLDESGVVKPIDYIEQYGYVETTSNSLTISENNQRILFEIEGNKISTNIITRENMAIKESIKAYFKIDGNEIIGTNNNITINNGQTVAFIPLDGLSREEFNSGRISIYTDAWNNDLSLSEANRIKSGNSYLFDSSGEFHFYLCKECDTDNPIPTITIFVN